jgi:hypothetical protein
MKTSGLPGWSRLSEEARSLVTASYQYYDQGIFPSDLVSLIPPSLLTGASKKGVAL